MVEKNIFLKKISLNPCVNCNWSLQQLILKSRNKGKNDFYSNIFEGFLIHCTYTYYFSIHEAVLGFGLLASLSVFLEVKLKLELSWKHQVGIITGV